MLKPVSLTKEFMDNYYSRIMLDGKFRLADMRNDPIKFSRHMIGFSARDYQAHLFDQIDENQKVAFVKGRQIGFTTAIALYCLWYAWFNKHPSGTYKNTKICVVSKDDDAAKKLLSLIKDFMVMGDKHMAHFLKGRKEHSTNMFTSQIVVNNVDVLKLQNGSVINSFPPTAKVRGGSYDIIFIDEFDFLNNPDVKRFFYTDALPTISATGGKVIISSTPNGYGGLFHTIVDPEDKKDEHEFVRSMYPYTVNKDEEYLRQIRLLKDHLDVSEFSQEYECDFTQAANNFFSSRKVREMLDNSPDDLDSGNMECIAGIDYGMTEARTVITLVTQHEGIIYRIYSKEFESGWDINGVIPFMEGLRDRYKINKIVVDKCPQGESVNQQMREMGWPIEDFDFHSQKIEAYCGFRAKINKYPSGEIRMNYDAATEKQFLEMQQEESKMGKLMIHKPRSGRDDIVDSVVMACYPLLMAKHNVGAWLV